MSIKLIYIDIKNRVLGGVSEMGFTVYLLCRFLQMELKWKEDKSGQLPLRFSSCCFASDPRPFSFLPNGVIGQDLPTLWSVDFCNLCKRLRR